MSTVGGDFSRLSYVHPVIGTGVLFCKSNEDGTLEIGGFRSNDDDNSSTGDGQFIDQINWRRASFEAPPIAWDMTDRKEMEKLAAMAASPVLADWTMSHVSGQVFSGKGKPIGDIPGATNSAQITLKLAFEGQIKTQV
jgi:hypothetical protein